MLILMRLGLWIWNHHGRVENNLEAKDEETTVIMTGIQLNDELCLIADEVSKIETVNFKVF